MTHTSEPNDRENGCYEPTPNSPDIGREVLLACGLLFGLTFLLLGLEVFVPAMTGSSQGLLAVGLLLIPSWVLRKKSLRIEDLGATAGPMGSLAKHTLFVVLIVFPLFVAGFHLFQTSMLGASPQWSFESLKRWNQEIEYSPSAPCASSSTGPVAWIDRHGLWILGPPGTSLTVSGKGIPDSARRVSCSNQGNARAGTPLTKSQGVLASGPQLRGLLIDLDGADRIDLEVRENDASVPSPLRLGRTGEHSDRIDAHLSTGWLFTFFIIHLGLIALPEEWFFRGYLQGRLDQLWGTPWRFLGVDMGWGLIVSALAFAALHPILIPGFHRLLVFFPALLFGWLRARTQHIGSAVLVHALCNLLLAVISRMYGLG